MAHTAPSADSDAFTESLAEEMQMLRNFIEASFVKQTLQLQELMQRSQVVASNRSSRSGKQRSLQKTYSNTTLETEISAVENEKIALQPRDEDVQEERAEVREPEVARISSLQIPTSRAMGDSEGSGLSGASRMRTSFAHDTNFENRGSIAMSSDTFVASQIQSKLSKAEALVESSVGSIQRFSTGLRRAETIEIDPEKVSKFRVICFNLVASPYFTNCIMVLILLNMVLLGVEVNSSVSLGQLDVPRWYGVVNTIIVCIFLLEIILKFVAYGLQGFLCGRDSFWNNLDFVVIAASVMETAVEIWDLSMAIGGTASASHLRIMRTMRLVRALRGIRVIRLLRYVSALRTLVFSIVSTTGSLMWTLVLLFLLWYSFGVILTQLVSDHCRFESIQVSGDLNAKPNCSDMELAKFWNDVPESMITLFLAITGGLSWDDAFRPLREVSVFAMSLLILYIIVTVFAVLNVVTGVFCNTAIESAQSDKDIAIMKQMRKHDAQVQALRNIFKEIDHDKSMHVTLMELQEALSAKKLSSFMESMGISTQDVSTLFMIIDTDRSGMIDLDEFVSGCMQLHGPAKSLQLAQMSHENKVTRQVIKHVANSVSAIKQQLNAVVMFLDERPVGTACAV